MKYYLGKGTEFKKEECKEYKTIEGALKAAAKDESLVVWDENGQVIGSLTDNVPDGALTTNPDGSVNAYNENRQQVGTVDPATVAAASGNGTEQSGDNAGASTEGENGNSGGNTPPANENGQNGANTEAGAEGTASGNGTEQSGDNAGASTEGENGNSGGNTPPTQENGQNGQENDSDNGQQDKDEVIIPQGTMKVIVVCDGALNLRRSAAWGNDNICGRATRGQSYYVKEIHTIDGKKMVRTIDDLYLSGASEHVQFEQL